MKITSKKTDLLNSINIVLKAVSPKTTLPILESIVIEAKDNMIKMITNDMELGIETIVKGQVDNQGTIAISAKLFSDIVRKLPDNDVFIEVDENFHMKINCERSSFNIPGMNPEEFPFLPKVDRSNKIEISQFSLKEIIRQTVFSISENDVNKIMSGELFEIKEDKLRVISLDGHRISIRSILLKEKFGNFSVLVPGRTLIEISKILTGGTEDIVNIYFTDKHIIFEFDDTMVLSRLLEGDFFKVDQMITNDYETKVTINKRQFMDSIDRSTLLVKESEKKPIIVNINDDVMNLKVVSSMGAMREEVDIVKSGQNIKIGFNPRFFMDALKAIDDEEINIYLFNPKAPCYIRNDEAGYLYLILPINFIDDEE